MKRWSKEELDCLLEISKDKRIKKEDLLLKLQGRTLRAIRKRKRLMGLDLKIITATKIMWNKQEDEIIKKYYLLENNKDVLLNLLPHRKWNNIHKRAIALGFIKKHKWTHEEDILLERIYYNSSSDELKNHFPNRLRTSINNHACHLGLKRGYKHIRESDMSALLSETPETYYWIGFLLADGYINHDKWRLKFALAPKDANSVIDFANFIKCPNIHIYKTRHITVSAQDQEILPKLCEKFKIVSRKTYHPPSLDFITNPELLISLIVGYIDGDGCIRKLHNRKDFHIIMKCHSSWINIYHLFEKKLYEIFNINKRKERQLTKICKSGYALLNISDSRICKKLKEKALEMKLPIMQRKWDAIDLNFIGKPEQADKNKKTVIELYQQNKNFKEIMAITGLKYTCIYGILSRSNTLK